MQLVWTQRVCLPVVPIRCITPNWARASSTTNPRTEPLQPIRCSAGQQSSAIRQKIPQLCNTMQILCCPNWSRPEVAPGQGSRCQIQRSYLVRSICSSAVNICTSPQQIPESSCSNQDECGRIHRGSQKHLHHRKVLYFPSKTGPRWAVAFTSSGGTIMAATISVAVTVAFAAFWNLVCVVAVLYKRTGSRRHYPPW